MAAEFAPEGDRALRRRRFSHDARRGLEVHQRRADRRAAIRAGARWPERPRDGSGGALDRRTRRLPARAGEWRLCATVVQRRVSRRRACVQSAVCPGNEPGGRGAVSRPVRPARSAGVHRAEHGLPPGRRVCVDPTGHDYRPAHFAAVCVGVTRDRERVAPARADCRRRGQSSPDR